MRSRSWIGVRVVLQARDGFNLRLGAGLGFGSEFMFNCGEEIISSSAP